MWETIIGVCGTLAGTLLGWLLQFIKTKKLYFSEIKINPIIKDEFFKAYFELNIYNSSHYTRAIRNPVIVCYCGNQEVFSDNIQESHLFENFEEKEEYEQYRHDLKLINIPAHGNISQSCMIENWELGCLITKAVLVYEDEKFRKKKIKVLWINKENKNG